MSGGSIKNRRLQIDDQIPEEQWSDARRQYILEEKSLSLIGKEQHMDPRTVSKLVKNNWNFDRVGKHQSPSKVEPYAGTILDLLTSGCLHRYSGIMTVSEKILALIRSLGYTGSERTLREYLKTIEWQDLILNTSKRNEPER